VLKERGAKSVYAYCTHPIFSGPAIERITHSALDEVVVTNTIPLSDGALACGKVRQLSVAPHRRDDPAHCQGRVGDEFVLGPGQPVLIWAKSGRHLPFFGMAPLLNRSRTGRGGLSQELL
jgi:hypothetical protein